jgi:hypothetical protein
MNMFVDIWFKFRPRLTRRINKLPAWDLSNASYRLRASKGAANELIAALDAKAFHQLARRWKLVDEGTQELLRDVRPRLDFDANTNEGDHSRQTNKLRTSCGRKCMAQPHTSYLLNIG